MSGPESARDASPAGGDRMETLIGQLLRAGVLTSMAFVAAGLVLMFVHHPSYLRSTEDLKRLTGPGAAFPRSLADVGTGLRDARGQAVVALGLILLILTPILRVAVSIVSFALRRDRPFVLVTSAVLALLLTSFLLGKAG